MDTGHEKAVDDAYDDGYKFGYEAGKKDMAKELEKNLEKEKKYHYEEGKKTYEKKDKSDYLFHMGGHSALAGILTKLGEDEDE